MIITPTKRKNNEQRIQSSTACTLQQDMPGGQTLAGNVAHVCGHIPDGALIKGWTAYVDAASGWGVTVSIGTVANPTLFATALVVTSVNVNDKAVPMEIFFPVGEDIVVNVTAGADTAGEGVFQFVLDYTEVNTTNGCYTA